MTVHFPTRHHAASLAAEDTGLEITCSEVQTTTPTVPAAHAACVPESGELFQATFELNPLPMWVYDNSTLQFLEVNQAALQKYGYSRDEFLEMTLLDIRPESEHQMLMQHLQHVVQHQSKNSEQTWVHLKKSGESIEVQVHGQDLQYQGRPARLGVILDVTEKSRIRRALEESQAQFRLIAENTVNLIMQFDANFHASYVSPSITAILGYTPEEFLAIPDYGYIHPEDWPMVEQEVTAAVERHADQHMLEYRIRHKEGHHLWCETAFRLIWEGEVCHGFISSSLDISDRVVARQELMASLTTSTQLVTLAEELEEASDPSDVIQLALKHCTAVIPFDYGMFVKVTDHQYQVDTCLNLSPEEGEVLLGRYLKAAGPRLLHAFLKGTPAFFSASEPICEPAESLPRMDAFQVAVLPVTADGRIQGFLALGTCTDKVEFTGNTRRILRAVRDRISHAFERNTYIEKLSTSREETLKAIGMVLEYRDYETKGHTDRVVQLSDLLGRALGINGDELDALRWGAYLHDTGKIAIPDHILLKPGRLTPEEFEQVKKHSEIGFEMLKNIPSLPQATLDVILHHHERWDGNGYPAKMAGYSIPLAARIFTVVDVYDALISRRPYKEPFTHEAAMAEIQRCANSMFDPEVVKVFSEVMEHEMLRHPEEGAEQQNARSA
ncbi:HD domain-containing phosphohydrolase [Deinococcus cellulosilyticus]|uniref:Uncharacterized protein n=1 Tax=Deinococcus cellulosilyticus (strain DSM 18568 / NBRC 106333 / KACC 11606 / 5516J-15) TaxID=1223518 RepID=A0A511NAC3_DEIC1|nr:HD domain-containing phosphohydrolase [Deinococcus cellulosilyticus]GEM49760.1 hypothetical protein DC3_53950 [Deinococcus cellulosilyticus NBRC 106333 = KACC 11606]